MEKLYPTAHYCAKFAKYANSGRLKSSAAILLILLAFLASSLFTPQQAAAGQATLGWGASTSSGVIGYKVYFGTSSGNYTQNIDVGNVTSYTVTSLNDGQTYYFAAKAYNSSGSLSGYSNEINGTISSSAPATYSITATANSNGTITAQNNSNVTTSSSGSTVTTTVTVNSGASQAFSITPNSGYSISGVTVDGASVGAVTSYTFSSVAANHTISATFSASAVNTYTLTASAGTGGAISPSGGITVNAGASQSFSVSPSTGYYTTSVTVDGTAVATNQGFYNYTFSNVSANHTITASFAVAAYTISATAGSGGSISPASALISYGGSQTVTITPNSGYKVSNVTVDGTSVGAVSTYTFSNVAANHTINATFASNITTSYTITASAGTGGSISPSGTVSAASGSSQTFTITPATGYYTASVTVDGTVVATNQGSYSYTFSNVAANHTISAAFAVAGYTITPTAGTGGSISPTSALVSYGGSQTFTVSPSTGYYTTSVTVDGTVVASNQGFYSYTFSNVSANHTISATFALATFKITATAGSNGSISPTSPLVNYGSSQTFTITPASGHSISGVLVDGVSVGKVSSYTFSNVTACHTIQATFK